MNGTTATPARAEPVGTPAPKLRASIVLVMMTDFRAISRTVDRIAEQTIANQLELVILTGEGKGRIPDYPALSAIGKVTVVEITGIAYGMAQAEGVRRASAPVVILGEDHAWPEPGYAEALASACKAPYTAVGPAMVNANPWSAMSWGNLILAYGPWTDPVERGPVKTLPGTNTAYRREVLLGYGAELDRLMQREGGLLRRLRADGHEFFLESRARTAHQNISGFAATMSLRFWGGRLYAARRAQCEGWGTAKRAMYTLASPLIPVVRFVRVVGALRRRGFPLTPRAVSGVGLGLFLDGVGQMSGFSMGVGNAAARLENHEHDRARFLSKRDRIEARI